MRLLTAVLTMLCCLPAPAAAQQPAADAGRRAALEARRDSLEAELMQRFLDQLFRELQVEAATRAEVERVVQEGAARRRELLRSSGELRLRLHRAMRNDAATDADFTRLLAAHEALRQRETEIWRGEQEQLARVLSPRQRAQFVVHWVRFHDQVRDIVMQQMRSRRGESRGSRPDGPGGASSFPEG
jgi:Spy/CpxP family protein refolding chaperone